MPAAQAAKQETPVFLLAAEILAELTENSHQGHRLPTAIRYQSNELANSNTASSLRVCLYDSRGRSRCTGEERDAETGMDFFGARYMSSAQGRFSSADPLGNFVANAADPQSWNMYAYARNNPLVFVDPSGLACVYAGADNGTAADYEDPTNYIDDKNGGQTCAEAFASPPEEEDVSASYGQSDDFGNVTFFATGTGQNPGQPGGSPQNRLACAAKFGQNHSIAAAFGAQNTFVGNLLGGNTFSGIADLGQMAFGNKTPNGRTAATALLSGGGQGLLPNGSPGAQGAAGMLSDLVVGGGARVGYRLPQEAYNLARGSWATATTVSGGAAEEAAATAFDAVTPLAETATSAAVGWFNVAKLGFDLGTFAYGAIFACH